MILKLWKVKPRTGHQGNGYNGFITAAYTEDEARNQIPAEHNPASAEPEKETRYLEWVRRNWGYTPEDVIVECIGIAGEGIKPGDILLASYQCENC
jgi:hypothetical protein